MLKSTQELPEELVDSVISHLDGDLTALRNCCLVCTSWLPVSRAYLLRTIRIDLSSLKNPPHSGEYKAAIETIKESYASLSRSLATNPERAKFARALEIRGQIASTDAQGDLDNILAEIVSQLPVLKSISLIHIHWMGDKTVYTNAIYGALALPSLTQLTLHRFIVLHAMQLIDLSTRSPNLRDLSFSSIYSFNRESVSNINLSDRNDPLGAQSVRLEKLYLRGPSVQRQFSWLTYPQSPICIAGVRQLTLDNTALRQRKPQMTSIGPNLLRLAVGVRDLRIEVNRTFKPDAICLPPDLERLEIRSSLLNLFGPLVQVTRDIPHLHSLKTVVIITRLDPVIKRGQLGHLDEVLSAARSLREVIFELQSSAPINVTEIEEFQSGFPSLTLNHRLQCVNSIESLEEAGNQERVFSR
ncbi:hypothetical protein BD779DRAFT_1506532 [Infundibulicybe gibba]|nr:hypothetical protein BD779DRAFT_1506532 [Infundibulicybe gibba]